MQWNLEMNSFTGMEYCFGCSNLVVFEFSLISIDKCNDSFCSVAQLGFLLYYILHLHQLKWFITIFVYIRFEWYDKNVVIFWWKHLSCSWMGRKFLLCVWRRTLVKPLSEQLLGIEHTVNWKLILLPITKSIWFQSHSFLGLIYLYSCRI